MQCDIKRVILAVNHFTVPILQRDFSKLECRVSSEVVLT